MASRSLGASLEPAEMASRSLGASLEPAEMASRSLGASLESAEMASRSLGFCVALSLFLPRAFVASPSPLPFATPSPSPLPFATPSPSSSPSPSPRTPTPNTSIDTARPFTSTSTFSAELANTFSTPYFCANSAQPRAHASSMFKVLPTHSTFCLACCTASSSRACS